MGVRDSEGTQSHYIIRPRLPSGASVLFADWILERVDEEEDGDLVSRNLSALSATLLQHFVGLRVVHVFLIGIV